MVSFSDDHSYSTTLILRKRHCLCELSPFFVVWWSDWKRWWGGCAAACLGSWDMHLPNPPNVEKGKGLAMDALVVRHEPTGFMASVKGASGQRSMRVKGPFANVPRTPERLHSCFMAVSLGLFALSPMRISFLKRDEILLLPGTGFYTTENSCLTTLRMWDAELWKACCCHRRGTIWPIPRSQVLIWLRRYPILFNFMSINLSFFFIVIPFAMLLVFFSISDLVPMLWSLGTNLCGCYWRAWDLRSLQIPWREVKDVEEVSALKKSLGKTRDKMEKIRRGHQKLNRHDNSNLVLMSKNRTSKYNL